MSRIRILPDRVANQIAAGEVVERPVAVVKELVENSLDAGATRITVEFRQGGKALIRVEDNGGGMARDEAMLALERHATSKLREAADLQRIASFGFRGEALPSIASVSRFTLRSRPEGQLEGSEIVVNAGRIVARKECGMPVGTVVEVASLFHGVPARRKFLKTDATEAAHIVQLVRLLAIAHPEVAFTLWEDGRERFRSPGGGTLRERVRATFGAQLAADLLELDTAPGPGGVHLRGLISPPGQGQGSRQTMFTFVNRRPVDSRLLTQALAEVYQGWIPRGRYPAAFLMVEIDPERADVNVHPSKREVRFRDEAQVRGAVMLAVKDRLEEVPGPATRPGVVDGTAPAAASGEAQPVPVPGPQDPARRWAADWLASAARSQGGPPAPALPAQPEGPPATPGTAAPATPAPAPSPAPAPPRCLGRVREDYAIFEAPGGLCLMHRRHARARIEYEAVKARLLAGDIRSQPLLFPVPLEVDAPSAVALDEGLGFLAANGFTIAPFGRQFYRIEAVPDWVDPAEAETVVRDLVAGFRERGGIPAKPELGAERLAREAAARAAQREEASDPAALERLWGELLRCSHPLANPEGRPTLYELPWIDLARRFGRD